MRVWNTIDSTALACRIHFQFWQTCQVASVSDARDVPARDRPALKLIRTRHSFTQDSVGLNRRSTKGVCIWQIGPRRPSATIRGIGAQSRDVLLRTKIGDRGISTNLNNSPLTRCRFLITFASVYNLLVKRGRNLARFAAWLFARCVLGVDCVSTFRRRRGPKYTIDFAKCRHRRHPVG
jgi:hypothetical protein